MKKILNSPIKYIILAITLVLLIASSFLITKIKTNYDMTLYLPEDSKISEGLEILDDQFGNHATIQIMVSGIGLNDAMAIKQSMLSDEAVQEIIWFDNVLEAFGISWDDFSLEMLEFYPVEAKLAILEEMNRYYQDDNALFTVIFFDNDYSTQVAESIDRLHSILAGEDYYFRGQAISHRETRNITEHEILKIMLIIIPVCVLIVLIASKSWLEPVIILVTLLIAVLFNMGTNAFLPHVSFITLTIAAALQLAISLDYSLFLVHRYYEEREQNQSTLQAVINAQKHTFSSITASALTTITGFLALTFMKYGIGMDIGIVLSKGILFSYLASIIILPILLYITAPLLDKTMHKTLLPRFGNMSKKLFKYRLLIMSAFLVFAVGMYFIQSNAQFTYGDNQFKDPEYIIVRDDDAITDIFGMYQPIVILVANDTIDKEIALVTALSLHENIVEVDALVMRSDPEIPRMFLPLELVNRYVGSEYTRFIVYLNIRYENETMFTVVDFIEETLETIYVEDYYALGSAVATAEIKTTIIQDGIVVSILTISAIALILLIVFKSFTIPLILIAVIQVSIWSNIAWVSVRDLQPVYIGYLVVFALQLGATIDYAVLLTSRYMGFRKDYPVQESMKKALEKAMTPILISAVVLASAGFIEGFFSDLNAVKEIGYLIGRGALLSLIAVWIILPVFLMLFDKIIHQTTWPFKKREEPK